LKQKEIKKLVENLAKGAITLALRAAVTLKINPLLWSLLANV